MKKRVALKLMAKHKPKGYYRGASVLVSSSAGSGKSSLAAHFVNATRVAGERRAAASKSLGG